MKHVSWLTILIMAFTCIDFCLAQTINDTVFLKAEFTEDIGAMDPVWAWFGYDEPNYTYMKDGKKLLSEISALSPVPVFVRAHNLLTTGDGTP
jgi:xylan 1,4-beta-xylosidase